jgi:hypothetical protein
MDYEAELRAAISKVYVILSKKNMDPERMKVAGEKMEEVIGILGGTLPLPVVEGERG